MTTPSLPEQFTNWRLANLQEAGNRENAQRDFLNTHLQRKQLMEALASHPAWKLVSEFLSGKAEEALRKAMDADNPHEMQSNLMLVKAYHALIKFPSDTVAFAETAAKQQQR